MKKILLVLSLSLSLSLPATIAFAADTETAAPVKHKIVFQVNFDGEDRYNDVLGNIENTQKAFGKENVEIVVVAHGNGAALVTKGNNEALAKRIEAVTAAGAKFDLCTYTIAKKHIPDEAILPGVTKVQGGIAEVVRLQEKGYIYIKLGS